MKYTYCTLRKENSIKWVQIDKKLDMILKYKYSLMAKPKCYFKMVIKHHRSF